MKQRRNQGILRALSALPLILAAGLACLTAHAGQYTINWDTQDGGGATFLNSANGRYSLGMTIGQPDAGLHTTSRYILNGGFWGLLAAPLDFLSNGGATPNPAGVGDKITFTANASIPGVLYYWNFGDGSPVITGMTVYHTYPVAGTYTVMVTASYVNGQTASQLLNVSVNRKSPALQWATPDDIVFPTPLGALQLNATAAVPGTFAYSPPAGTVLQPGDDQQLSLTFTPNDTSVYNSASKSVLISVKELFLPPPNPQTRLYVNPSQGEPGQLVTFTADLNPGQYVTWNFGDGGQGAGPSVTHTYVNAGFYTVIGKVATGATVYTQKFSVEISSPLTRAITEVAVTPHPGTKNSPMSFTVFSNVDTNGITYRWLFGDNTNDASGINVTHTYALEGSYDVTVIATDVNGLRGIFPFTVYVLGDTITPGPDLGDSTVNPEDMLGVTVIFAANGIRGLNIDVNNLIRDSVDVETDFGIPGRSSVSGTSPVMQYDKPGIYIANVVAKDRQTRETKGHARKTLIVGNRELHKPVNNTAEPADNSIPSRRTTGRFYFKKPGALTKEDPFVGRSDLVKTASDIELPEGMDVSAIPVQFSVGNITNSLTLGKLRNGRNPNGSISLQIPKSGIKDGKTGKGVKAKMIIVVKGPNLSEEGFDTEGVNPRVSSRTVSIQVAVMIDGVAYQDTITVVYKRNPSSSGGSLSGRR